MSDALTKKPSRSSPERAPEVPAAPESELPDAEIAVLAAEVEEHLLRGDARLAVGRLVAERYYGGDHELFRSRGQKPAALRRIAALVRERGRVPLSLSQLYRMTGVAFQAAALGGAADQLPFTAQAELLRVAGTGAKRRLADAAVAEGLTVRGLRARVDEHLGVVRAGPPDPVAAAVLAAKRLRDRLRSLAKEPGFDGEDGPRGALVEALRAALAAVKGEEPEGVPTSAHARAAGGIEEIATAAADAFLASGLADADLVDPFNALQGRVTSPTAAPPEAVATRRSTRRPRPARPERAAAQAEPPVEPMVDAATSPGNPPEAPPSSLRPPPEPSGTSGQPIREAAPRGGQVVRLDDDAPPAGPDETEPDINDEFEPDDAVFSREPPEAAAGGFVEESDR